MTRLALLADLDRCTGCQTCVVACKAQKRLAAGLSFVRLVQVGPIGRFPELTMYYLPVACQQCARPACAAACPEDALVAGTDGVVVVDAAKCTGCGDCVGACPYGAVMLDHVGSPANGEEPAARGALARKCDLCAELRADGGQPACVAVCPGRALAVVDSDSEATDLTGAPTATRRQDAGSLTLKAAAGTEPAGRFVLTRQPWRDEL